MGFANLCFSRSASRLASSVCGGRVRSISTVVNRPSLVHNPSPLSPFVSRGFLYSTAAVDDDWVSSEKAVLRVIDAEYKGPFDVVDDDVFTRFVKALWRNRSVGMRNPPASFPFKVEDNPGDRTVTLTREHNGEHIEVVVSMLFDNGSNDDAHSEESSDDHDDDAPSNESSNDDDDDCSCNTVIPFVVTVTKKSGRSLELRGRATESSYEIIIDAIHVNLPGEDPEVIQDMDDLVLMDHEGLKRKAFNKYLEIRGLNSSTFDIIKSYMLNKLKLEYWLWLDHVKEFLEE
ncbi:uncharacterized protein At2g39795, mitochondrial [Capsella rubella]|uniref:uncharacterized protein At2g39795, mitochondrial n=1 Tax=Capsella rubella TaxID=81985 RepID=UPI000CD5187A|nr:uncharacterized protein At2g39795, mitochondrial [Capsella rubella]